MCSIDVNDCPNAEFLFHLKEKLLQTLMKMFKSGENIKKIDVFNQDRPILKFSGNIDIFQYLFYHLK